MLTAVLRALVLSPLLQGSSPDPLRVVREVQRAVERDSADGLERRWRAVLSRRPHDPEALLAMGTLARVRYRYPQADSLFRRLYDVPHAAWQASGRLGMASWRALGADPQRADSLYAEARAFARTAASTALEAEAVLGLVQLRQRSQGPKAGQALLTEWWQLLARPAPEDSAQRLCIAGTIDEQLGDTTGYSRIAEGIRIAERRQSSRLAGQCHLAAAQAAERRGYLAGARISARKALAHFESARFDPGIALASQWYGYVLVRGATFAEGRALLERAIAAARVTGFASVEAWAHSGLAELHLTLGDLALARRHARVAAASHEERGDRWGMAGARLLEAQVLEATGDLPAASARYADVERAFSAAGMPFNATPALARRALLQVRLGQLDSANATLAAADRIGRTNEGWRNEGAVLRAIIAQREGRLATADSLLRSTPMAKAWRAGATSLAAVTVAAREAHLALRMNRPAAADSAMSAVVAALATWRRRPANEGLTATLAQLRSSWGGLREVFADIVGQLAARGRTADAFALVEEIRARDIAEMALRGAASLADSGAAVRFLARQRGTTGALDSSNVATLRHVQSALKADEAFVSYTLGLDDSHTTAIVVTRERVSALTLAGRNALVDDIRRFVQLATAGTEAVAPGRRLGLALVAPVVATVPETVTRLLVSADGELHALPFDALRLADGRFAIERGTITMAPSATALLALRALPGPTSDRLIAFGDPKYAGGGAAVRRERTPTAMLGDGPFAAVRLPRLTHSGDEARRVARYSTRRSVHLGSAASEETVQRIDWREVAVVHFAAHALVDPESESGTALALAPSAQADGFLTPAELGSLQLRGALVVLSACRSSGGKVLWGAGLQGLTAPLLEAGARTVVATHWSIGDRSVVPMVDRFYGALARGRRVDDALREAKLAAIRDRVSIADWGSFTILGDGSLRVPLTATGAGAPPAWVREGSQARRDTSGSGA